MSKRLSRGDALIESALEASSPAHERERLTFTFFIALLIHAVIIFGISFSVHSRNKSTPALEVTLAQHADNAAPKEADFLAQSHQEGSGTLVHKAELAVDARLDIANPNPATNDQTPQQHAVKVTTPQEKGLPVTTVSKTSIRAPSRPEKNTQTQNEQENESNIQNEIASLQAKLAEQRQQYAKRPRIKTITSAATRASPDAEYLSHWQEKIEVVGNLNYPEQARIRKLYGQLRLLVSLLPDGSVYEIEVLESSGQPVLDDAAIHTVRLAAPFTPFTLAMKKDTDRLEIIRTWKFERGDRLRSQ